MPPDHAETASPERAAGAHIVLGRLDLGRGPGGAREIGPLGKTDHDHEQRHSEAAQALTAKAGTEQRKRNDGHHQGRERELDVGRPCDEAIHPPPDIAREEAQGHADGGLDRHGKHAHEKRDARSVKDGTEQVAALRVGTEEEARVASL